MKKYELTLFFVALLILLFPNLVDAGNQPKSTRGTLIGNWKCQGSSGTSSLIFESKNRLAFNGEAVSYSLAPGAIRVQGDYGPVDYGYSLKGNTLYVSFPDGSRMQCLKTATAETGRGEKAGSENAGAGAGKADTGKAWQLKGMLCSWGGLLPLPAVTAGQQGSPLTAGEAFAIHRNLLSAAALDRPTVAGGRQTQAPIE